MRQLAVGFFRAEDQQRQIRALLCDHRKQLIAGGIIEFTLFGETNIGEDAEQIRFVPLVKVHRFFVGLGDKDFGTCAHP